MRGGAGSTAPPGYLAEREARFLMLAAAGAPTAGAIVEIGSFKGRSTVGLAYVAQRYGLGGGKGTRPHSSHPSLSYAVLCATKERPTVERPLKLPTSTSTLAVCVIGS